jgi:hypothetical protein
MEELMVANRVLSPLFLRASVLTLLAASAVACKSSSSGTEGRAQGLFDWVEVVFSLVEGAVGSGAGAVV